MEQQSIKTGLCLAVAFYLVCGVSAIVVPSTWLWVAGLSGPIDPLALLLFRLLGGYLLALSATSMVGVVSPPSRFTVACALLFANFADFLVVLAAGIRGELPIPQTIGFGVVDISWCIFAVLIVRCIKMRVRE